MYKASFTGLAAVCLLLAGLLASAAVCAESQLEAARNELRLRVEAERRMRHDFETLLAGGRMSETEVADFEEYLVGLGVMVDRQRAIVAGLEGKVPQNAAGGSQVTPLPGDFHRGQTDAEKIALLDAALGSSLSEFDEKMLREQKELAEKSRTSSSGEGGEDAAGGDGQSTQAGGAEGGQAEGKAGRDAPGSPDGGESEQQRKAREQAESGGDADKGEENKGSDQVASAGGASESGQQTGRTPPPPDIADGKDDDIVARQLREAAETEEDPELREKLWDEYRKYKSSTR
jgi:hypothetical protein